MSDSKTPLVVSSDGRQSYGAALDIDLRSNEPPPYSSSHGDGPIPSGGSSLSFHNVSYAVNVGLPCLRKGKVILRNCSGIMRRGLNAIMGPTGSGKTTMLDILADRKDRKGLTGHVLVNGERQPKNFKCMSGYVVQDDMIMGTLSVKENLYFSAALRLPFGMSWKEKKRRVNKLIDQLGLAVCADTKIGTEFFRGVSGGERKRTNIGMELIIEPQVLFLDEPTTGLDAFTAISVVHLLKQLCVGNSRIVIMSIHQPRYSIFRLCDSLCLLSRGDMVYHGSVTGVLDYFDKLGFQCEEHDNPADFLLDVLNHCEGQRVPSTDLLALENSASQANTDLPLAYAESAESQTLQTKCQELMDNAEATGRGGRSAFGTHAKYVTNFFWQLFIVIIRSSVNLARYPMTSVLQWFIVIVFAVLVGGIYFQLDTGPNGYGDRVGAFFFIIMNQIFGNMSAIDLFIRQKALFIHENASGYYRVSTYFLAKVVCDVVPMRLIPAALFCAITYFMIGLQVEVGKFFIFTLTVFLTALGAASTAFFVSACVKVAGMANLLVALAYVIQMLFGGFLIALDSLPAWIHWMKYLSLFRYSIEALSLNEMKGLLFNTTSSCECNQSSELVPGEELLMRQGYELNWLWYDQIALITYSVLFLALTYITLLLIRKDK